MAKDTMLIPVLPETRQKIIECKDPNESISHFVLTAILEYVKKVDDEKTIYVETEKFDNKKPVTIGVYIDKGLKDRIEELANNASKALGIRVSMAAIVRTAIDMKLKECAKLVLQK